MKKDGEFTVMSDFDEPEEINISNKITPTNLKF